MITPEEEDRNGLITIPDQNTSEAITYGSKYLFAKSTKWFWDSLEDEERKQIEELKRKIIDPEWAAYVLKNRRDMIFSNPYLDNIDHIRDLRTIREIVKRGTALEDIQFRRESNLMYARMHGIHEYCKQLTANGITETIWKSATADDDTPIEYETLRALKDNDAGTSRRKAMETLAEEEAARRQMEMYREETSRRIGDATADEPYEEEEERTIAEIPIYREIKEDTDYWRDEVSDEEMEEEQPDMNDPTAIAVLTLAYTWIESSQNTLLASLEATA